MDHDDWIFDDDARTLAELGIGKSLCKDTGHLLTVTR